MATGPRDSSPIRRVLVLAGGPDAEREVSLNSARAVSDALESLKTFAVHHRVIDRLTQAELAALPGEVILPMLHGAWGEGGPLQELLIADSRPFVGCGPTAARWAMDKLAIKLEAVKLGISTAEACVLNPRDHASPIGFPLVVKPVHDGSSVGLHIVKHSADWPIALQAVREDQQDHPGRAYMVERFIAGRELTVGILDGQALPVIEIIPSSGPYDYNAKYVRSDTRYMIDPPLPSGMYEKIQHDAERLFVAIGARHLSRVDYLLDHAGHHWLLEINTLPGFTSHSLVPKAAAHRGLAMPQLCQRLVELALRDRSTPIT
jgi:D-alanine-D-alanine ligase